MLKFLGVFGLFFIFNSCVSYQTKNIRDLTHSFDKNTIYWPTGKNFKHQKDYYGQTPKGYFYSSYSLSAAEHGGTHIDAPRHFNLEGQTLDQIPLTRLVGSGVVINISSACDKNKDYLITMQDFLDWERENKQYLYDKIILLNTGFARYWPNKLLYMGTDKTGPEAIKNLHFPGLDPKAALWLAEKRNIKSIGIDTPSIDYGQSSNFESHRVLFKHNIPAFENITNLTDLPSFGFEVVALPMKIKDGSGGPLRIIAIF